MPCRHRPAVVCFFWPSMMCIWCRAVWWLAPLPQSNGVLGSKPSSFMCGVCVLFPGLCGFLQTAPVSSTTARLIFTPINRIWNQMGKSIIFASPKTFIALLWHDRWWVEHSADSEEFQIWFPWMFLNQPGSRQYIFSFFVVTSQLGFRVSMTITPLWQDAKFEFSV